MKTEPERNYMPLLGGMAWTETQVPNSNTSLTIFTRPTEEDGTYYPAEHICLGHENARRLYMLLEKSFGKPQLTDA